MLRICKAVVPLFAVVALLACAEEAADEASEEAADTTAAAEEISLADFAGTWNMRTTSTNPADTFVNEYQIVIDETGWTMVFPERDPVQATVELQGDNVVTEATFESVRMPGTSVTTNSIFRLEGDRLVGDVTAHWHFAGGDSTGQLRTEGTRAP